MILEISQCTAILRTFERLVEELLSRYNTLKELSTKQILELETKVKELEDKLKNYESNNS